MEAEEKITSGEALFEKWRRTAGIFLGPAVFVVILFLPFAELTAAAHRLLAIISLVVIYWITEAIPIPSTALLGAALCIILGVDEEKTVLVSFANPIIFLFMGSFMLAESMRIHRLDKRISYFILSRRFFSRSYFGILAGVSSLTAFLSMWISNTATTAMVYPIALGIVASLSHF